MSSEFSSTNIRLKEHSFGPKSRDLVVSRIVFESCTNKEPKIVHSSLPTCLMLEVQMGESLVWAVDADDIGKILRVLCSSILDYPC
jgi:hypothetical protein